MLQVAVQHLIVFAQGEEGRGFLDLQVGLHLHLPHLHRVDFFAARQVPVGLRDPTA